jgi:probable F420-dependent oxidoreductase
MKIGAIYPQTELQGNPRALDSIGRAVEALGYDYLVMFDHVAGAVRENRNPPLWGPYTEQDPFHDPLVSFGYLAGITQRIELVTGILILPQRQTLLVARQSTDVDLLSGGRLRLGVGVGWNHVEFDALGQSFHTRGQRMDEQIAVLRRLWKESPVSFQGRFDALDRVAINPRPTRQIPLYCGGGSEAAFKRAAATADGFLFSGPMEERVLPGWERLKQLLDEHGRQAGGFGADFLLPHAPSIPVALDAVRRWEDAGGTHAAIRTMGLGFSTAQQHIDYLAAVIQRLK